MFQQEVLSLDEQTNYVKSTILMAWKINEIACHLISRNIFHCFAKSQYMKITEILTFLAENFVKPTFLLKS